MTMDISGWIIAFAFGGVIGLFYFMGLWWTVQSLPQRRRPALWVTASYFIRTAVTVFAFYLVMGSHWQRLLVSLLGFVMVRIVLVRRLRPAKAVIGPTPAESDLGMKELSEGLTIDD